MNNILKYQKKMEKKTYKYRKLNSNTKPTGLDSIDNHHKEFVTLINNLVDILNGNKNKTDILTIFHKLLYYAEMYFIEEELYYKKENYSYLQEHLQKHSDFIESITTFKQCYEKGSEKIYEKMMKFLDKWYKEHFLKDDFEATKIINE